VIVAILIALLLVGTPLTTWYMIVPLVTSDDTSYNIELEDNQWGQIYCKDMLITEINNKTSYQMLDSCSV
jgi:hypothetical protein